MTTCTPIQSENPPQPTSSPSMNSSVNSNPNAGDYSYQAEIMHLIIEEFNCNHQADAENAQQTIFNRDREQKQIEAFLHGNYNKKNSGLMYLCGHPGTGKTSLLN